MRTGLLAVEAADAVAAVEAVADEDEIVIVMMLQRQWNEWNRLRVGVTVTTNWNRKTNLVADAVEAADVAETGTATTTLKSSTRTSRYLATVTTKTQAKVVIRAEAEVVDADGVAAEIAMKSSKETTKPSQKKSLASDPVDVTGMRKRVTANQAILISQHDPEVAFRHGRMRYLE
jgi:hypothetical protein